MRHAVKLPPVPDAVGGYVNRLGKLVHAQA
jgi:hypothetical protein